jgi:hypothetical protein
MEGRLARIDVRVVPGARRTSLVGRHGDGWRASVTARPERGRANEAVERLIAGTVGVPVSAVRVVAGRSSRSKVVEVAGLTFDEAARRLDAAGGVSA